MKYEYVLYNDYNNIIYLLCIYILYSLYYSVFQPVESLQVFTMINKNYEFAYNLRVCNLLFDVQFIIEYMNTRGKVVKANFFFKYFSNSVHLSIYFSLDFN